jgi:DNA-directed RNA polymerase alpha subunit
MAYMQTIQEVNLNASKPISDIDWSLDTLRCLRKLKCKTLGDITAFPPSQLLAKTSDELRFRRGPLNISEVQSTLNKYGLDLKPERVASHVDDLPISHINWSFRVSMCLERLGCQTLGDIMKHPSRDFLTIKNVGLVSLWEIQRKLSDIGLTLLDG